MKGAPRSLTEDRVLRILREYGPMRGSYVGEYLWADRSNKRTFLPQRFARAAGRVLNRMKERELIWQDTDLKWHWGAHRLDVPKKGKPKRSNYKVEPGLAEQRRRTIAHAKGTYS